MECNKPKKKPSLPEEVIDWVDYHLASVKYVRYTWLIDHTITTNYLHFHQIGHKLVDKYFTEAKKNIQELTIKIEVKFPCSVIRNWTRPSAIEVLHFFFSLFHRNIKVQLFESVSPCLGIPFSRLKSLLVLIILILISTYRQIGKSKPPKNPFSLTSWGSLRLRKYTYFEN